MRTSRTRNRLQISVHACERHGVLGTVRGGAGRAARVAGMATRRRGCRLGRGKLATARRHCCSKQVSPGVQSCLPAACARPAHSTACAGRVHQRVLAAAGQCGRRAPCSRLNTPTHPAGSKVQGPIILSSIIRRHGARPVIGSRQHLNWACTACDHELQQRTHAAATRVRTLLLSRPSPSALEAADHSEPADPGRASRP